MLKPDRAERGQVLVLFVAIFSMVLVLLAFAVDQGFWFANRRVKQGDADTAARAGAFGYLSGGLSDTTSAATYATTAAERNGADEGVTVSTSSNCNIGAETIIGAPSVTVQIETNVPGLFSRVPWLGSTSIDIGAEATACVGAAQRLVVANNYDSSPDPGDNTWKSIPIAIRGDSGGPCYESTSVLDIGHECAILGPLSGPDEHRLLFNDPPANECKDGSPPDPDDIDDGVSFTCWIDQSIGCGGQMQCVHVDDVNSVDEQGEAFFAMWERLQLAPSCDDSFAGSFGAVAAPPKFGGAEPERAYMQSGCFDTRRVVVLPVTEDQGSGSGNRRVIGFTVVYITGCYHKDDPSDDPSIDLDDATVGCLLAWARTRGFLGPPDRDYEIRGVPINTFSIDGSIGDIGSTEQNSILTIQTVK